MEHGKSCSEKLELGSRRKALDKEGKIQVLAPRHFRKLGRHYMNEVTDSEILKVYFGINVDFKVLEKKVQTAKGQITKSLNADKKEFAIFSKTDGYCGEEFVESEETGTARRKGIAAERDIQDLHEKAIAFRIA